jgi:hypothetical protein
MVGLVLAPVALAQPTGSAPTFVVVSDTNPGQGQIVLTTKKVAHELTPRQQLYNVNGRVMTRTYYLSRMYYIHDMLDARDSCVITPDGKQLPIDEVWRRLKPGTVLVVSGDFDRPAPEFLRALSAETLVFIPAAAKK